MYLASLYAATPELCVLACDRPCTQTYVCKDITAGTSSTVVTYGCAKHILVGSMGARYFSIAACGIHPTVGMHIVPSTLANGCCLKKQAMPSQLCAPIACSYTHAVCPCQALRRCHGKPSTSEQV